jgi:predicted ATPase
VKADVKMKNKTLIRKINLQNFLSYGSQGEEIELQPLNVLIGTNGSGKSNFIEAFRILKAIPTDLMAPIRQGGGINEFIWKGAIASTAVLEVVLNNAEQDFNYQISFRSANQRLEILSEVIEQTEIGKEYRLSSEQSVIARGFNPKAAGAQTLFVNQEFFYLKNQFSDIGFYRDWHLGQGSTLRKPQHTDLPEHPLEEDGSNLGLVLNDLQYQLPSQQILEQFKKFYPDAEELNIKIYGGTVQIFIREKRFSQPIPAPRLSDGTLHYLFLMALLLDPNPAPLLCIEEPELGLHPDVLPTIAEMLIEASQKTQLIVTTHSDILISALPTESVLVCERDNEGSHLRRLNPEQLKEWLENYTIGDLWLMGEIGGRQW